MEIELQSTESLLREYRRCYETSQLICVLCGRTLPGQAKKCHLCRNSNLFPRYCTSESRIAELFAVLRKVELWPTAVPFKTYSISNITSRFTSAKAELKHSCAAGNSCPLLMNLEALLGRVSRVRKRIVGLCLSCVREDKLEANTKCCHK
jgi:ribosomal protein L40E